MFSKALSSIFSNGMNSLVPVKSNIFGRSNIQKENYQLNTLKYQFKSVIMKESIFGKDSELWSPKVSGIDGTSFNTSIVLYPKNAFFKDYSNNSCFSLSDCPDLSTGPSQFFSGNPSSFISESSSSASESSSNFSDSSSSSSGSSNGTAPASSSASSLHSGLEGSPSDTSVLHPGVDGPSSAIPCPFSSISSSPPLGPNQISTESIIGVLKLMGPSVSSEQLKSVIYMFCPSISEKSNGCETYPISPIDSAVGKDSTTVSATLANLESSLVVYQPDHQNSNFQDQDTSPEPDDFLFSDEQLAADLYSLLAVMMSVPTDAQPMEEPFDMDEHLPRVIEIESDEDITPIPSPTLSSSSLSSENIGTGPYEKQPTDHKPKPLQGLFGPIKTTPSCDQFKDSDLLNLYPPPNFSDQGLLDSTSNLAAYSLFGPCLPTTTALFGNW